MNKVLIVRLGSLGDIIHAVPAAMAIRRAYPRAEVDWLVDARHADLLDLVPVVQRRMVLDTSRLGSIARALRELRAGHYDVALDLQGLIKSAVLARVANARRVIGFPSFLLREQAASVFYTETAGEPAAHVVYKNLSMLKAIGIRVPDLEFALDDRNPQIAFEVRRRLQVGDRDPFAIINPGAAWLNKRWPAVYFAEVAQALAHRYNMRSVVLWGPGEQQLAENVVAAAHGTAAVSPRTTIADLVSLTRAATIMISGDTGPLHVAGAVGTPLVGIFGPTDPARNGPWSEGDLTVSRFEACACRYQRRCRIQGWCLLDISPREVMELVDRRLSACGPREAPGGSPALPDRRARASGGGDPTSTKE